MLLKRVILMFSVALFSIVFIGCNQTNDVLIDLEKTIMEVEEIVYEDDFDSIVSLSLESQETTTELSDNNLRENFLNLRLELRYIHYEFMEVVYRNKQTVVEIRTLIRNLKSNEIPLSEDDINLIQEQILIIRENRKAIMDTKGDGYLRLKELKGQYNIENYDLVMQTITEVIEVIENRLLYIGNIEESLIGIQIILNL